MRFYILVMFCLLALSAFADETAQTRMPALLFNPPSGWRAADPNALPPSVKVMIVSPSNSIFAPSMNFAIEDYSGTLKEYLKIVKAINASQNSEWKDLGPIQTQAGKGNLSQVDVSTQWGMVRLMHVILVKNHQAYILTASALVDEFPRYYPEFLKAMRSLRFGEVTPEELTAFESITKP